MSGVGVAILRAGAGSGVWCVFKNLSSDELSRKMRFLDAVVAMGETVGIAVGVGVNAGEGVGVDVGVRVGDIVGSGVGVGYFGFSAVVGVVGIPLKISEG